MPSTQLNLDILYEFVGAVASIDSKAHRKRLLLNLSLALALACRTLLYATRPVIFAKIKWAPIKISMTRNQVSSESSLRRFYGFITSKLSFFRLPNYKIYS